MSPQATSSSNTQLKNNQNQISQPCIPLTENQKTYFQSLQNLPFKTLYYVEGNLAYLVSNDPFIPPNLAAKETRLGLVPDFTGALRLDPSFLLKYIKIDFVEINKQFIEIARAKLDKYKDIITYHNMSFFDFKTDKKYDYIFGNPPYKLTINNKNIYDVDFFLKCWDLLSYKIMFLMSPTSITGKTKSHKLFIDIIDDYGISKKKIRDDASVSIGNQFRVYKNKEFQDKKTTQAGLTGVKTYLYVLEKNISNNSSINTSSI